MTPILILIIGVKPVTAIGTDIAYGAITRTVGAWRHWRRRTVDVPLSLWMAVGSVPAAVIGVVALKALQHTEKKSFDDTVVITVGAVLLLCGIAMIARLLLTQAVSRERGRTQLTPMQRLVAVVLGVGIGFVIGVTSAGSGALITIALILVFNLAPRQVVATDMFHAAILLWAAALAHVVAGDVDYGLMGTILIGAIPGVWVGSALAYRVPVGALRTALATLLIGASLALGQKGGLNIPTAVIAAFPAGVAVMFLIWWYRSRTRTGTEAGRARDAAPVRAELQATPD